VIGQLPAWHEIFVHFSIGLLTTALAFYIVAWLAPRRPLWRTGMLLAARWNLAAGVAITFATILSGFYAAPDPASATVVVHRNWSLGALAAFLAVGVFGWVRIHRFKEPTALFLALLTGAGTLLIIAAYTGYMAS
jgi:uncharacterized membrane protein